MSSNVKLNLYQMNKQESIYRLHLLGRALIGALVMYITLWCGKIIEVALTVGG